MRKITVFNFISLDGYFSGPNGEVDWFRSIDKDDGYDKQAHEQSAAGSALLFGRTTYEMMKNYWPTAEARKADPAMAEVMNRSEKMVVSRTLQHEDDEPHWKNVRIINDMSKEVIESIKGQKGKAITILGSGSIVQQLANWNLIDEYHLMVVPVLIGAGKNLFANVRRTDLRMMDTRYYRNGIVRLKYAAV